ncbi:MAG: hypothetical protein ACLGH8_01590 [Bacteroidia bacterium]
MKSKITFLTLICLLVSAVSFGQMNRRVAPMQYKNGPTGGTKKQKEASEMAAEYYQKELDLDDFQKAAVEEIYKSEDNNIKAVTEDLEMNNDIRKEKVQLIIERIDGKIEKLLSPEQLEKFEKLKKKRKK